jgi:hypothetical protein
VSPSYELGTEERGRPGWAFWSAVLFSLPLFYVLLLGPACWISSRTGGADVVKRVYRPLTWMVHAAGSPVLTDAIQSYSGLGTTGDWSWTFWEESGDVAWMPLFFDLEFSTPTLTPTPLATLSTTVLREVQAAGNEVPQGAEP